MNKASLFNILLIIPSFSTACLSTILGSKESKSDHYSVPKPDSGWQKMDPAEADSAYRNTVDQAVLNITSVCGSERYRSLEHLTSDILKQLPEQNVTTPSEARTIGGFPGLVTSAEGQVDGSPLKVKVAVVRTERCLYDFILAGSTLDTSSVQTFEKTLEGFQERSK